VSGDRVVFASTEHVFGWPVAGGAPEELGRLPDLGPATNNILEGGGFVRIEAAQPGRVLVVRGGGNAIGPQAGGSDGPAHQLAVGPPEGPFTDPAGCGERSGGPAGMSGDLIAYAAAPAARPRCAGGARPAVGASAVLVRDLAAGNDVVRSVPVPFDGAVADLRFDGPFLGLELRPRDEDPDLDRSPPRRTLRVVDARTGAVVTEVGTRGELAWDIGPDGTLVQGALVESGRRACGGTVVAPRVHAPGDAAGRPLGGRVCAFPAPEVRAGPRLRASTALPDGRTRIADRSLADGSERELAVVAGPLVGGDDGHLVGRRRDLPGLRRADHRPRRRPGAPGGSGDLPRHRPRAPVREGRADDRGARRVCARLPGADRPAGLPAGGRRDLGLRGAAADPAGRAAADPVPARPRGGPGAAGVARDARGQRRRPGPRHRRHPDLPGPGTALKRRYGRGFRPPPGPSRAGGRPSRSS
jgi:hypothetical protein